MLEPISPELVLVDPELGREVRARLLQHQHLLLLNTEFFGAMKEKKGRLP